MGFLSIGSMLISLFYLFAQNPSPEVFERCSDKTKAKSIIENKWLKEEVPRVSDPAISSIILQIGDSPIRNRGNPVDTASLNTSFRQWFLKNKEEKKALVVPGFSHPKADAPLHKFAIIRLMKALCYLEENHFFIVTGGNAAFENAPNNEALEMKHWLVETAKVPAHRILAEPFAMNTPQNLRNVSIALKALNLKEALLITDPGQNYIIAHDVLSGLSLRAWFLGIDMGVNTQMADKFSTKLTLKE